MGYFVNRNLKQKASMNDVVVKKIKQKMIKVGVPDPNVKIDIRKEFHSNDFRVAIFGSARSKPEDQEYQDAFELARMIADSGFDLVNGGGPGIMQAASEGHNAGCSLGQDVHTIGLNIELPFEQHANRFLDVVENNGTFSRRLDQFMLLSSVVVVAPGGVGTCLEFFYTWQLMQVKHICKVPIILMGDLWTGLIEWVRKELLGRGYINPEDLYPLVQVNTPEQAMAIIKVAHDAFEEAGDEACVNINVYKAAVEQLGL